MKKNLVSILAGLLIATSCSQPNIPQQTQIYEQTVPSEIIIGEVHTLQKATEVPDYFRILSFFLEDMNKKGLLESSDGFGFTSANVYTVISPFRNKNEGKLYSQLVQTTTQDIFDFYSMPKQQFTIDIPLQQPDMDETKIYLVNDFHQRVETNFWFLNKNERLEQKIIMDTPSAGSVNRYMKIIYENGKSRANSKSGPIFLAYKNRGDVVNIESAPLEILHKTLNKTTEEHILKEFEATYSGGSVEELQNRLIIKWNTREEHAVHAAGSIWLLDYTTRNGSPSQQEVLSRINSYTQNPIYRKVPHIMQQFIGREGGFSILKLYRENPEELFRGSGL